MTRPIVVFNHIPKTAGTTMRRVMRRQYSREGLLITEEGPSPETIEALRRRVADESVPLEAIGGHVGYGIHHYLPDDRSYHYFTFIRSPVERVISNYYQWQRSHSVLPDMDSLSDFVRVSRLAHNLQTAFLAGIIYPLFINGRTALDLASHDPFAGMDRDRVLAQAKENLARHVVVGLTERFDESLVLIARALGWPFHRLPYLRLNVGHNRPPQAAIHDRVRREIADRNDLDLELYAFAKDIFTRQLDVADEGVHRRFAALSRTNRLLDGVVGPFVPALTNVRRRLRGIG